MKIKDAFEEVLSEATMRKHDVGMGLTAYQGQRFILHGGYRSGNSSAGFVRLKYDIYDSTKDFNDTKANPVGFVELFVDGSEQIRGLVNIEFNKKARGGGFGREIVRDIVDTTPDGELTIHDVKPNARGFWEKMGIEWTDKRNGVIRS